MNASRQIPILVADDDEDITRYFTIIFKDPRYKLYLASNGYEALERAKKEKIDLAFIDVMMPEMDGLETLIGWKKIQPNTQIVIILLKGFKLGNLIVSYQTRNIVLKIILIIVIFNLCELRELCGE